MLDNEGAFRSTLEKLHDLPIVGDVRGDGYFYGIELVKDKATKETFDDDESERLLRGFLSKALFEAGLYCRADDRGDPVIQLAPPLIVDQSEFDEIEQILRAVLTEAWRSLTADLLTSGSGARAAPRVRRLPEKQVDDARRPDAVLDAGLVAHVAVVDRRGRGSRTSSRSPTRATATACCSTGRPRSRLFRSLADGRADLPDGHAARRAGAGAVGVRVVDALPLRDGARALPAARRVTTQGAGAAT